MRDNAGHDGAHVSGERGTTVEAEPTHPQENGAENDVGDVVRPVGQAGGLGVPSSLTDHNGEGERSSTRRDVDGRATGEVEATHDEGPTVGVPGPVRDRVVYDGGPDEHEDDARENARTVNSSTDRKSRSIYRAGLSVPSAFFEMGGYHTNSVWNLHASHRSKTFG